VYKYHPAVNPIAKAITIEIPFWNLRDLCTTTNVNKKANAPIATATISGF
jgi:hypothetical protein